MDLYNVAVSIEDEPAYFDYAVLVAADSPAQARGLAKTGAIDAYNGTAYGWSSTPKAIVRSCKRLVIKPGVLLARKVA